jgi:hypothetical protein
VDALGMVVNRDCELALGSFLADNVLVEKILDLKRPWNFVGTGGGWLWFIVVKNRIAYRDALIANVGSGILAWG